MRAILKSPRVLRTGQPLTLEGIRQVCPAVFATEPHGSLSPRYRYVPTIEPLQRLLENGWGIYEASQQRSRSADKDPYTKHMLRMRKLEDFDTSQVSREGVAEVVMINAHDGSACYKLKAGFFRFICSNGMMVGTHISGFTVKHTISSQTSAEVLEAGERTLTEKFPAMLENIDMFRSITLTYEQQYRLAQEGQRLRYPSTLAPFATHELLTARRPEDEAPTLWNTLNRLQENLLYGGWETKSLGYARKSAVRPVERVTAVAAINGGLWDAATKLAKELA